MKHVARVFAAVLLVSVSALASACGSGSPSSASTLSPKVEPPVVSEAGVLKVGLDFAYMPYSAEVEGEIVGIDADVAALVAEDLGLKVEYVDVVPSDAVTAIQEGVADIVMSTPLGRVSATSVAVAGVYGAEAPAVFALAGEDGAAPQVDLAVAPIGVQAGSVASWELKRGWSATGVVEYESLQEALDALVEGAVEAVACDAMVGLHLRTRYEGLTFVAQLTPATALGIGVHPDNTELSQAIAQSLDKATTDGRMELLMARWVGQRPVLTVGE